MTVEMLGPRTRTTLKRVLPDPVVAAIRNWRGQWDVNEPMFYRGASMGPLVTDMYDIIRQWPGWFGYDDCIAFQLILRTQSLLGLRADLLEIGTFFGRSTAVLASLLGQGETLVACDIFDLPYHYESNEGASTPEQLWRNIATVNPSLPSDRIEIIKAYSSELQFSSSRRFRFCHVDGGHTFEVALGDLRLCAKHTVPGGVIAVDDYHHPSWPEVTTAIHAFLQERPDFAVMADVNRYANAGRKLYLCRQFDQS